MQELASLSASKVVYASHNWRLWEEIAVMSQIGPDTPQARTG